MCKYRFVMLLVVLVSSLFLLVSSVYAGEKDGVTGDTIKIGIIADLTGPTVALQIPAVNAMKSYFKNINEKGGVFGRKIKAIAEDDRYTIPMHVSAFKKLAYRDKVFMIMEIGSTGGILSLIPRFNKLKMPNFMTSTAKMFVKPTMPYHFTNGAAYEDEVRIIFNYLFNVLKVKNPKLGLVRPDTEHGKVGSRATAEQVKRFGTKLLAEEILAPGAMEAGSQVLNLRRQKINYIILHLTVANSVAFLRDAKKYGIKAKFYGTKYTCTETTVQMAGKAAKEFYAINSFASWYDDEPGVKEMRKVSLKYYPDLNKKIPPKIWTQGWAEAVIVYEGIKRAGKNLTRNGVIKAWESMKNYNMKGLSANATFGPNKHQCSEHCKIYKADIPNGKLAPISDWIK